jgi:c(7)-type cytochrome triheme protein
MKKVSFSLIAVVAIVVVSLAEQERSWKKLADDGLHDPGLPALQMLQEPEEALKELPFDYVGNQVLWNKALAEGYISPRTNLYPGTEIEISDMDIVMGRTGEAALVLFPHREHTEWLDCSNCHNGIFIDKFGANAMNMMAILNGEYCGVCHGAVSFPLVECNRCHSIPRSEFMGTFGVQHSVKIGDEDSN